MIPKKIHYTLNNNNWTSIQLSSPAQDETDTGNEFETCVSNMTMKRKEIRCFHHNNSIQVCKMLLRLWLGLSQVPSVRSITIALRHFVPLDSFISFFFRQPILAITRLEHNKCFGTLHVVSYANWREWVGCWKSRMCELWTL